MMNRSYHSVNHVCSSVETSLAPLEIQRKLFLKDESIRVNFRFLANVSFLASRNKNKGKIISQLCKKNKKLVQKRKYTCTISNNVRIG